MKPGPSLEYLELGQEYLLSYTILNTKVLSWVNYPLTLQFDNIFI